MSKYIEEIEIKSYEELVRIIQGKDEEYNKDLRDDFIFRGIEDSNFQLIPSALREDKINDYVDEDFKIKIKLRRQKAMEIGLESSDKNIGNRFQYYKINKYMDEISGEVNDTVSSLDELQFRKEFNALMNFLNTADKVGLKIPTNQMVRNFIEHETNENFKNIEFWPNENFYELISLAQHYGVPTRALDWAYDYKVSLYFVVKNILVDNYKNIEKPKCGVLWAYNYKHFEKERLSLSHNPFKIQFYRLEYNTNPNLNAQINSNNQ